MAKSGIPDFARGRVGVEGRAAGHRGAASHDPHPQPRPTRGRGGIRGTVAPQLSDYGPMSGDSMRPQRRVPTAPAQGVTQWRRIADDLEQAIALGTHAAGDRLPGEVEIASRFGVNRHTVRRALAELSQRGLVRAERGSGTYVERRRLA